MLLALYDKLTEFYNQMEKDDPQFEEVFQTRTDIKRQILNDGSVRLQLLDMDQKVWENLVKILKGEEAGRWKRYYLYKRYAYVCKELLNDDNFSTPTELLGFYKKLINIELLQIAVPDISDAYQVFASLNSKGMPLTPLDLLKNIYLSKNGELVKWDQLKDNFEKNEKEDTAKLTPFILNNFDAFETDSASSLTKGKIVKTYEKLFKEKGANYIDILNDRALKYVDIANEGSEYNWGLSGLAKLDATSAYPLLLNILVNQEKYELTEDQIKSILIDLIKLFILRNIALTPKASNLRSSLNSLRKSISEHGWKSDELVKNIHEQVKQIQPRWDAVEVALQDGIYDKNKKTARFILIALEREYGTYFNKANPDFLDEYDAGGNLRWSIEHIIPQGSNLSDEWKDILSPDDRDHATEIQSQNVHRLGNLTLTPYNSEMGNKSFNLKKNFKINDQLVGLSLGIYLNTSINKTKNIFGIDELNARQASLIKEVKKLFVIR